MNLLNLRTPVFAALCSVAVAGCDDDSEGTPSSGGSTSNDSDDSDASGPVSVSISVTSPGTDPSSTVTMGDTEGPDTDGTDTEGPQTDGSDTEGPDTDAPTTDASDTDTETDGETDGETEGTTAVADDDTIYEIQMGDVAEGADVLAEGVVITAIRDGIGLYVEEPGGGQFSGVYVDAGQFDLSGFAVGDVVDVSGTVSEDIPGGGGLTGLTGIVADDGAGDIVPTGDSMPLEPDVVDFSDLATAATAEPWEGVLITVTDTLVVSADGFDAFSEFRLEVGGDSVIVDNFLYGIFDDENAGDFPGFAVGAAFTDVTGVLNFSFDDYKLAPRSADELAGYSAP